VTEGWVDSVEEELALGEAVEPPSMRPPRAPSLEEPEAEGLAVLVPALLPAEPSVAAGAGWPEVPERVLPV
jgi:hypothetical protein